MPLSDAATNAQHYGNNQYHHRGYKHICLAQRIAQMFDSLAPLQLYFIR
jgi:hypothetical protein